MNQTSNPVALPEHLRVFVSAGASGIGRAIAEAFADNGARVWVCDVSEDALSTIQAERPDWQASHCDVSCEPEVAALFSAIREAWGGLDVLVNNAGIAGPTAEVEAIAPNEWRRTVDVNLNGQFYCAHHGVPLLRGSGHASMICISSVAGRLGYARRTPYAATKWAVVGLMKSLAIELGPEGIRVNAILPGFVEGPRFRGVISARAESLGTTYEAVEQGYLEKVSLRRMVTEEDVANTALYLCSPLGRSISGQALSVCGNVETL